MVMVCEDCVACRQGRAKSDEPPRCPCGHHRSEHRESKPAARRDAPRAVVMKPLEAFGRAEA